MNEILLIGLGIFGGLSYLVICYLLLKLVLDFMDDLLFYWDEFLAVLLVVLSCILVTTLEIMLAIFIIDLLV